VKDVGDFFRKRQPVARPASVPKEEVTSRRGEQPTWATQGTAYFDAIGRTLARLEPPQPSIPAVVESAKPLPARRTPTPPAADPKWSTCHGDQDAEIGDLVALSLLDNPDARGRIVAAAKDGRPECVLGDFDDPKRRRQRVAVDAHQLLMVLRKAVKGGEPVDEPLS
jgi:hypothetical protein